MSLIKGVVSGGFAVLGQSSKKLAKRALHRFNPLNNSLINFVTVISHGYITYQQIFFLFSPVFPKCFYLFPVKCSS